MPADPTDAVTLTSRGHRFTVRYGPGDARAAIRAIAGWARNPRVPLGRQAAIRMAEQVCEQAAARKGG